MSYFQHLLDLLAIEKAADLAQYRQLTGHAPAAERRAAGLTWYPVAIRGTEVTRGDYLSVEIERTTHQELSHQFRFGAAVRLFSNHDPKNSGEEGWITFVGNSRMKLSFRIEELPDWASEGKLGVDLLFDNSSYEDMEKALKAAEKRAGDPESGGLIRLLTGEAGKAESEPGDNPEPIPGLNASQQEAVANILSAGALAIVHGPPGTGKTTTLIQAIKALHARDRQQILVVAPSNTAVDLLSEKLLDEGMRVLRIGNPARISEKMLSLSLDSQLAAHPGSKQLKKLKKQAAEYKNMAHKYKRKFGRAEQEQRQALFNEAHKIMKEVTVSEEFLVSELVDDAQVITATLVGADHYTVRGRNYHTVVIDEAGQALEPACWIPILKAKKLVMAGDPFQLPPTVKSTETARKGLSVTLLEKAFSRHPEALTLLRVQYRMHEQIMGYSSQVFYGGAMQADPAVAGRLLFPGDIPLLFIDTAGAGFNEQQEGTSTINPEEAAFLLKHLEQTLKETGNQWDETLSVAVISPYKEQVRLLSEQLGDLQIDTGRISVNTIDSFQGQERDIVYISLTRSNEAGDIGFLADTRRMNVAMTRAKKKLVVIGDSATLAKLPFYAGLIAYADDKGGYRTVWEYVI